MTVDGGLEELVTYPQVQRGLFILRIQHLDPDSSFHRDLVYALSACEPGAPDGELILVARFVVGQEKARALTEHAAASIEAKQMKRLEARKIRQESRSVSQSAAERIVEESEAYWALKRVEALSDATVQACTDLLFALQAAGDTWRTRRADERAADQWSAQVGT